MPTKMTQPDLELLEDENTSGMRVAILEEPYKIRLARAKIPEPRKDEVLIKIKYVGICGSDVEAYIGNREYDLTDEEARGKFLGVANISQTIGRIPGLMLGGYIAEFIPFLSNSFNFEIKRIIHT